MKVQACHSIELDQWITERHYLHSTPCGARVRLEILDDNGHRIGAMMWGRPTARSLDQNSLLELTRMYLIDETEPYAESKALALARKHIRKHLPDIKGLISYASTGEGHEGTIYQADGWFALGMTKKRKAGWTTRANRKDRDLSQKIRWVRTP